MKNARKQTLKNNQLMIKLIETKRSKMSASDMLGKDGQFLTDIIIKLECSNIIINSLEENLKIEKEFSNKLIESINNLKHK